MGDEFVPIERNPGPRLVRGDRQRVFDHKWPHRILVDREAMDFQPAAFR